MTPLRVQTVAPMGLVAGHPVHLDALLQAVEARRRGLERPSCLAEVQPVPIPIARSACDRYYLASAAVVAETVAYETVHQHRRFPVQHALYLSGPKLKRIDESAGPQKAFRLPLQRRHPLDGVLTWYCIGEREPIADLLVDVTHLGRRRHAGEGVLTYRGERWTVAPCETWPGFPVLGRDGAVLRNLPLDVDGIGEHVPRFGRYSPPYWLPDEEPIAAPVTR